MPAFLTAALLSTFLLGIPIAVMMDMSYWKTFTFNFFLAELPLVFALVFSWADATNRRALRILSFVVWLLFFPNSHYMVTDFFHIRDIRYYIEPFWSVALINKTGAWAMMMYLFAVSFAAVLIGCISLNIIHRVVERRTGKKGGWAFVTVICFLGGYAIYLGRFIKLNSWDVLKPQLFLVKLEQLITRFAAEFTLSAGILIMLTYLLFVFIRKIKY